MQGRGSVDFEERRSFLFNQLDKLTTRTRLLQRSMRVFYLALGVFVGTSVAIGLVAAVGRPSYAWFPVVLGLAGACGLFYGSVLLIHESRIAQESLNAEMDFIWKLGRALAPPDLRQTRSPHQPPHVRRRKPYGEDIIPGLTNRASVASRPALERCSKPAPSARRLGNNRPRGELARCYRAPSPSSPPTRRTRRGDGAHGDESAGTSSSATATSLVYCRTIKSHSAQGEIRNEVTRASGRDDA